MQRQKNYGVMRINLTMLINPENLDSYLESLLPITNANKATGPSNINIIYREKAYIFLIWIPHI